MDLTQSIEPRSDQVNADDLVGGPITYTIREVRQGAAEQPFDFMLAETDRAYRPSKTMRRLIVAAWGPDANQYAGRRLTLYREPTIKFGGQTVGGIRISHMSHIPKRIEEKFQTTRGKREKFSVEPLREPVEQDHPPIELITGPQLTKLHILFKEKGKADRGVALAYLESLGYPVESSKDLTKYGASVAIEALEQLPDMVRDGQLDRIAALFDEDNVTDRNQRLDIVRDIVGLDIGSTNELTAHDADRVIDYLGQTAGAP